MNVLTRSKVDPVKLYTTISGGHVGKAGAVREGDRLRGSDPRVLEHPELFVLADLPTIEIAEAKAGDIIAVTKLRETTTGDTFTDKASYIVYDSVVFPTPAISFAIEPKSRNDEDKLSQALHKMLEEDLALNFTRDPQTKEFLLSGTGQVHIEVAVNKLKKRYGVEVALHQPKVAYLEMSVFELCYRASDHFGV